MGAQLVPDSNKDVAVVCCASETVAAAGRFREISALLGRPWVFHGGLIHVLGVPEQMFLRFINRSE
jgi:hypothetical protein